MKLNDDTKIKFALDIYGNRLKIIKDTIDNLKYLSDIWNNPEEKLYNTEIHNSIKDSYNKLSNLYNNINSNGYDGKYKLIHNVLVVYSIMNKDNTDINFTVLENNYLVTNDTMVRFKFIDNEDITSKVLNNISKHNTINKDIDKYIDIIRNLLNHDYIECTIYTYRLLVGSLEIYDSTEDGLEIIE